MPKRKVFANSVTFYYLFYDLEERGLLSPNEVILWNYTNLGTFQYHIYGVHSDVSCTIAEESIAMNNTELYSESDCADFDNSDTGHGEPYCEGNIETDNLINVTVSAKPSMLAC